MTARRSRATREPSDPSKPASPKPERAGRTKRDDGASEDTAPPFEEGMERLEQLVGELEGGELPLERALGAFEEGVGLARALDRQLDEAAQRVEVLLREGGRLATEPLDAEGDDEGPGDARHKEA